MKYSITSICKNLSMNSQKYVLHWKKWSFETIANSAHTTELLALGKFLDIYIDYFMFYPNRHSK